MKIDAKQLSGKPKVIGKWNKKPVYQAVTKGGYHLILDHTGKTLGVGPIAAVARHIAQEHQPELELTELSKGEYVDPRWYQDILPKYNDLTERMRKLQG